MKLVVSLTIVNDNLSLKIVNDDPALTIINICVNKIFIFNNNRFFRSDLLLKTIVKKLSQIGSIYTIVIRFLKVQNEWSFLKTIIFSENETIVFGND